MKNETTVNCKRSNQVRNSGKEKAADMHGKHAIDIDHKKQRHADKMAAKAEKRARLAAQ